MQLDPSLGRRGNVTLTSEAQIYVNWKVDRICLMNLSQANAQSLEVLVDKCKKNKLESLAVGFELELQPWRKNGPHFNGLSVEQQVETFIDLDPWNIGLSELILFPCVRFREDQIGFLQLACERMLKDGKTIHFKNVNPSEPGVDRHVIRTLKLGRLELLEDIDLAARTQEEMESSDTKQGTSIDTEAMGYPEIEICEAIFHKVKGREHWPINKRVVSIS